ncbi:MAG: Radical domain protein [Deltaproteobacteria bacterium]|nr:Radical domain protein [Deltaproteobacteria bacterium]
MNQDNLLNVSKPTRYIGGEINAVVKDLSQVRLKFALAFPDVYEVGMSHVGFQILYDLLNQRPEIACERVFAPWPDMEQDLRRHTHPLTSLESALPLKEFDVIGFSLQYELNYTGVLNILDLAGIPFRAAERGSAFPLIIGGGPCALNPEPLVDFFDAFVLGDGEEAVLEITREVISSRESQESKEALLKRLSRLEGVYVPSHFQVTYQTDGKIERILSSEENHPSIRRRILSDLNLASFPGRPILPFLEVIHDRLNIEIARGCTRGCRFCQAGMIYRPLRERSPEKILKILEEGLKATGHDEVSLLSLSSGDYSAIEPLLSFIIDRYCGMQVAVSLPSLRVETLTPALIHKIREIRKTGFTLAVEAGTERLRRVINKGNTEADLLQTIPKVFAAGWRLVKLYFMIGLPTETEEDLDAIVSLCQKAFWEARKTKGSAQINISISTFIPKPHTPFQWEAQDSPDEVRRKQILLRKKLEREGIRLKWSDPNLSLLEGVLARGDRRLGTVLESAYRHGSRLDGWGDHFRFDSWKKSFEETGLDPFFFTSRRRDIHEIFPWEHLDSRVSKKFFWEEREKAFQGVATPDCRRASCNGCGVCFGPEGLSNRLASGEGNGFFAFGHPEKKTDSSFPIRRFRIRFSKSGQAKYLGHLEMTRLLIRAFRRAQIPLVFSQGFHPLPRVSFGPPLPVGHESRAEYLDAQLQGRFQPDEAAKRINSVLPLGVQILEIQEISLKSASIFDMIEKVRYRVSFLDSPEISTDLALAFREAEKFPVFWAKKNRSMDLKEVVDFLSVEERNEIEMILRVDREGVMRPEEALGFIFGWAGGQNPIRAIQKVQVQFKESDPCPAKS